MLKAISTSTPNNIWQKLENAPEGEADPMSTAEEDTTIGGVKTFLDFKDVLSLIKSHQRTSTPKPHINSMPNNIWKKLENAPEGEADPMSTAEEDVAIDGKATSLDFKDVLDVINPLQHIPIVSTIYRNVTGDTMNDVPKFLGSALFSGPVGLITALGTTIIKAQANIERNSPSDKVSSNEKLDENISLNNKGQRKQKLEVVEPENRPYSLVNSQKPKMFQLNAHQSDTIQTVNGSALNRLIKSSPPTKADQSTNQNSHKPGNRVIVDRQNVEKWMLEKLIKYEKLEGVK